jgi:hypothetical protein
VVAPGGVGCYVLPWFAVPGVRSSSSIRSVVAISVRVTIVTVAVMSLLPVPVAHPQVARDATPSAVVSDASLAKLRTAIVVVSAPDGNGGTGFFLDEKGNVLTNRHVVGDAKTATVRLPDGTALPGRVLESDPVLDLAIVSTRYITPAWIPLARGISDRDLGDDVIVIGTPRNSEVASSVTRGIVSGIRDQGGTRFIQTDVAMDRGIRGGPMVLGRCGAVIGVVSATRSESEGTAVAVDATSIRRAYPRRFPAPPAACDAARTIVASVPGTKPRGDAAVPPSRSADAPVHRPLTGTVLRRSEQQPGRAELNVINHLATDAVVTLGTSAGPSLSFYVRAGERAAVTDILEREYVLSYTTGTGWTGVDFLRSAGTFRLDGPLSLEGASIIVRGSRGTTVKPVASEPWTVILRPTTGDRTPDSPASSATAPRKR